MIKKILGALALLLLFGGALGFGYLYLRQPASAPPPDIQVAMTPERVERGRYLFQVLGDCDSCHSVRDFTRFGGPVVEGGRGKGFAFPPELGLPGTVVAPNITPDKETGIGNWTDGEKIRAIREGVSRDGSALFPMMPYQLLRNMSDEDVESLVAYMNTLAPARNPLPRSKIDFPVSMLIKSAPQPAGSVPPVDRSDRLKFGEYLATLGGCIGCHTKEERGELVAGMEFGGGREFRMPYGVVVSANISPDPETGIGRWSERQFIDKFYEYKEYAEHGSPKVGPEGFTLMPWLSLTRLPEEELAAIFAYLKTRPPVRNPVETHPGQPQQQPNTKP
jgi:mono/diheme cytochrome c family protein